MYKRQYNDKSNNNNTKLSDLIRAISNFDSVKRVRYTTSHPVNMDEELILEHKNNTKLMPFLHLPVQSGSNRILKSMNRGHIVEEYVEIINKLRVVRKDICFSSDFIVGYPEETEKDFKEIGSLFEL